jgi:hypothetical protein
VGPLLLKADAPAAPLDVGLDLGERRPLGGLTDLLDDRLLLDLVGVVDVPVFDPVVMSVRGREHVDTPALARAKPVPS